LSRSLPIRRSPVLSPVRRAPLRPLALLLALSAVSLLLAACGDDEATNGDAANEFGGQGYPRLEGDYEDNCDGYVRRLRDCGLVSEGPLQCFEPVDSQDVCYFGCLTTASCSLLGSAQCYGSAPPISSCFESCNYFLCDGDLEVPQYYVCDYQIDCADGTDEVDCEYFACGSGEIINAEYRCDAGFHCQDGSDEIDCPKFECGDGLLIPVQWICDFAEDCDGGEDEADCAHITCESDGEHLPQAWRCDLEDDCLDGSDEWDCAQLLCR
jgi:hypothetical protein